MKCDRYLLVFDLLLIYVSWLKYEMLYQSQDKFSFINVNIIIIFHNSRLYIWVNIFVYCKCGSFHGNPTKPGTSCKTCFWKRGLAQNYFQIFKFVFSCLLSGEQGTMYPILSNAWKNLFKWDFFSNNKWWIKSVNPYIHSCSKWKTNWSISKKCSEAKIHRCHFC